MIGPSATPEIRRKLKEIQEAVIRAIPDVGQLYPPQGTRKCGKCSGKGILLGSDESSFFTGECWECQGSGRVRNTECRLMLTRPIRLSDVFHAWKGWREGLDSDTLAMTALVLIVLTGWNMALDDLALQDAKLVTFLHSIFYPHE